MGVRYRWRMQRRADRRWDQSAPAETLWICLHWDHCIAHNSYVCYRLQPPTLGRSKPVFEKPAGSADTSVSVHCGLGRRSRWSSPFAAALRLHRHARPFGATHEHRPWAGSSGGGGSAGGWPLTRRPPFSAQDVSFSSYGCLSVGRPHQLISAEFCGKIPQLQDTPHHTSTCNVCQDGGTKAARPSQASYISCTDHWWLRVLGFDTLHLLGTSCIHQHPNKHQHACGSIASTVASSNK